MMESVILLRYCFGHRARAVSDGREPPGGDLWLPVWLVIGGGLTRRKLANFEWCRARDQNVGICFLCIHVCFLMILFFQATTNCLKPWIYPIIKKRKRSLLYSCRQLSKVPTTSVFLLTTMTSPLLIMVQFVMWTEVKIHIMRLNYSVLFFQSFRDAHKVVYLC